MTNERVNEIKWNTLKIGGFLFSIVFSGVGLGTLIIQTLSISQ